MATAPKPAQRHGRGAPIVVNPTIDRRAGERYESLERPAKDGPKRVVTTWECAACGNWLRSTRGISRCVRCGSPDVFRISEADAERQEQRVLQPQSYAAWSLPVADIDDDIPHIEQGD